MATNTKQKEYQRNYDKKTKMISVKYALHEIDDYDRLMDYLERTGKSVNSFIKELVNDFFDHKKYEMKDIKVIKDVEAEKETEEEIENKEELEKLEKLQEEDIKQKNEQHKK